MRLETILNSFALTVTIGLVIAGSASSAEPSSVAGKVYDLYVSQSFAPPPFLPFHDCARFTDRRMCLDACGDCGTLTVFPMAGNPTGAVWIGRVPCGGINLIFFGTSLDGARLPGPMGGNVLGASAIGTAEGTTFGAQGVQNDACTISPGKLNPYRKTEQK